MLLLKDGDRKPFGVAPSAIAGRFRKLSREESSDHAGSLIIERKPEPVIQLRG